MLCLTRREGEQLVINGNIRIIVNRIYKGRVSLGVIAPDDVRVLRGELCEDEPQEDEKISA
jgi:carbon storage regulator